MDESPQGRDTLKSEIEQEQGMDLDDACDAASDVKDAASGDRMAFDRLIGRFQGEIFRMVYYRVLARMDAEDITQEVFIKAYRAVGSLKDPATFRSWLYRIALNTIRDFYRKKRLRSIFTIFSREQEEEQACAPEHGPDHLHGKDFRKCLDAFLARLSSSEQEVFRLRFLDELSIREITEVLGKNESTVKTHLYRAVDKFRKEQELGKFLQEGQP